MTHDEMIVLIGALAFGVGSAIWARWSRARLERQDRSGRTPAE